LLHEEYFILLALGVSDGQGDLQYHQMRLASTKLIDLTSVSVTAEENSDVRLIQVNCRASKELDFYPSNPGSTPAGYLPRKKIIKNHPVCLS